MKRLSHEDWTRMNAMTLEIQSSSTEEELFDLVSRLVREYSGPECEVLATPAEPGTPPGLPTLGPWSLRLPQSVCESSCTFYEILSDHVFGAWKRLSGKFNYDTTALSKRQREVLPLLLRGDTNVEIAHALGISPRTIEKHITAILRLNGCASRSQLLARRAMGMVCWLLLFLGGLLQGQVIGGKKAALVIGNNDYQHATPLVSCVREAAAVSSVLRQAGFEVGEPVFNGTRQEMLDAADVFLERAKNAEVGLLYFAGHGMLLADQQTRDRSYNYMLPVDARLVSDRDEEIKSRTISVQYLLKGMTDVGASCKIVILDACQNNGLAAGRAAGNVRGGAGAEGDLPRDSFLALATIPGTQAGDGSESEMSPFTHALIDNIKAYPDASLMELFAGVNEDVTKRLGHEQVPVVLNTLSRKYIRFSFFPSGQTPSLDAPSKDASGKKTNSLGMIFLPFPGKEGAWICQCETRQRDFKTFLKEVPQNKTGAILLDSKILNQGDDTCPAVSISLDDALAFCQWLTAKEQNLPVGQGARLSSLQHYRLPTLSEWRFLAEAQLISKPDQNQFNLADLALGRLRPDWPYLSDVDDGTPYLSPADAARGGPAKHLLGNVWEWLSEQDRPGHGMVAGGAWNHAGSLSVDDLIQSKPRELRSSDIGFRLILATNPIE